MRHEARLAKPAKDGTPQRVHLEAAAERGSVPAQQALEGPECPEELGYLWRWFMVLNGARRYGMNGPERVALVDIDAADRLLGWHLRPQEVEALITVDMFWLHPGEDKD